MTNPIVAGSGTERWQTVQAYTGVLSYTNVVTISPLYYHQFQLTLEYSIANTPAGSPTVTNIVSYTSFGSAGLTATPTLAPTATTQVWADAGSSVKYTSPIVSGSERWIVTSADSGTYTAVSSVTATATVNPSYYNQFQLTLEYSIANTPAGTPTVTNIVSYTSFGTAGLTATPTLAPTATTQVWADAGSAVKYNSPIVSGSERWIVTSADSGTYTAVASVTAASTVNPSYYNQFQLTLEYSIANTPAGSPTVTNIVSYTSFGTAGLTATPTLAPTATTQVWADAGSAVKYNSPIVSGSERWMVTSADSGTYTAVASVTAASTVNPSYYNQFQLTLEYSIANTPAGSPTVTNIVSYTSFGSAGLTATPTLAPTATTQVWADAGSSVKYTSPIVSGSERWIVTSADSGTYTAVSSVTATATVNPSYYNQFQLTLEYSIANTPAGTPTVTNIVSCTSFGTAGLTATPTLAPTATTQVWADAGSAVKYNSPIVSGSERWIVTSADSGTYTAVASVTAASTVNPSYYNQFQLTLEYSIANTPAGSPTVTNIVSYTSFGSAGLTATPTLAPTATTQVWADAGSAVKYNSPIVSGSERWMVTSADSGTYTAVASVTAASTVNPSYYHQFAQTLSYTVSGGGSPTAPTLTSKQFGATYTPSLTGTATAYWLDNGATWSVTNPLTGSGSTERWQTSQTVSGTVSAAQTIAFTFYNQYLLTLEYTISNTPAGSPTVTNIVSYTTFGGAATATPTLAPTATTTVWADAASAVKYISPIVSGSERWIVTSADTGNYTAVSSVAASSTVNPSYFNQYQVSASFTTSDGSTPTANIVLSSTQFGSTTYTLTLTTVAQSIWLDAGAGWSTNTPIISATQQWIASSGTSGTIASGVTITPIYAHQFQVTFNVSPSSGGSIAPSGTQWVTAGYVSVSTATNSGYSFASLSSPTLSVLTPTSTSSLVIINGVGTVTANFAVITYPITVTQSSNGAISPASTTVDYGLSKTFTITPDSGYYITNVVVNGSSVGTPSSYTFRNVYASQTITASFAPISASGVTTVNATLTSTNTVYSIQVTGNATISGMKITPYQSNSTTAVTFTIAGQSGTTAVINMTIPMSAIPFGTYPLVYIDGQLAQVQGYTQDGTNYYVWFTTHFSTHQVEIEFTTTPPVTPSPTPAPTTPVTLYYVSIIVVIVVVVAVATVLLTRRRKKSNAVAVEQ